MGEAKTIPRKTRIQAQNEELILKAAEPPPPPRRVTKPTKGSVERRLKEKSGRSVVKKMRGRPDGD